MPDMISRFINYLDVGIIPDMVSRFIASDVNEIAFNNVKNTEETNNKKDTSQKQKHHDNIYKAIHNWLTKSNKNYIFDLC